MALMRLVAPACLSIGVLLGADGAACAQAPAPEAAPRDGAKSDPVAPADAEKARAERLTQLVSWMTGSFASTEQSKKDAAYFDIRMHIAPIWVDRTDARWLYVEQALATRMEQPYRQRVYRVTAVDASTFKSEVFELPDGGAAYIGAWADGAVKLKDLKPESLITREGCDLTLKFDEKAVGGPVYAGATHEKDCKSMLRGATYATSEGKISRTQMVSWDRGYDEAGKQVWGSEKGGYVFIKQAVEPKPAAKPDGAKPPAKKPDAETKPAAPSAASPPTAPAPIPSPAKP